MKLQQLKQNAQAILVAEASCEVGLDTMDVLTTHEWSRSEARRKNDELCKQVRNAINFELVGSADDDLLRYLMVTHVEPVLDSSDLLVVVVSPCMTSARLDADMVVAVLESMASQLRQAVAVAIRPKSVPELSFRFLPESPEEED